MSKKVTKVDPGDHGILANCWYSEEKSTPVKSPLPLWERWVFWFFKKVFWG